MAESWGIKISLPGVDVNKATPEQCVIHSKYDVHKINDHANPPHYGVLVLNVVNEPASPSTTNILTINHGYAYRPAAFIHIRDSGSNPPFLVTGHRSLDAFDQSYLQAYTTDTQFRIDLVKNGPITLAGRVFNIRYYIFAEDGS